MKSNTIFEVNAKQKKWEGIFTILTGFFIIIVILIYLLFLKKLDFFQDSILMSIASHIKIHIIKFTAFGSLYVSFLGGLFFIFFPMEVYLFNALRNGNTFITFFFFMAGIIISYSLDYLIGMKLSRISKKLIPAKKFYEIKAFLNRYGKIAVVGISAIPFAPSQQVTFILGVFRYNKTRLFFLTLTGLLIKYTTILLLVKLF